MFVHDDAGAKVAAADALVPEQAHVVFRYVLVVFSFFFFCFVFSWYVRVCDFIGWN